MEYHLDIKENALDSFNEALAKFEQGENGELRHYGVFQASCHH